jgi:hypothetical protein
VKNVSVGGFSINYQDGSAAKGDYITDEFVIGSANMILQMGLVTNSTVGNQNGGIMGIGYDTNEESKTEYKNFMDQMVTDK